MVEGAVFLRQDHHVLHVLDGVPVTPGLNRQRLLDRGRKNGGGNAGARRSGERAQKIASVAVGRAHEASSSRGCETTDTLTRANADAVTIVGGRRSRSEPKSRRRGTNPCL